MKTKFSNAEKVSDGFLKLKYEEIANRFNNFKKINFVYRPFIEKLEAVIRSEADNYEKLKALLSVEREFEDYIGSKDYLIEIIRTLIFRLTDYDIQTKKETYLSKRVNVIGEDLWITGSREEIIFELLYGVNEAILHNVYKELDAKFLPGEEIYSFASIAKNLTENDKTSLIDELKNRYKNFFVEVFRNHSLIEFDECYFEYYNSVTFIRIALEAYWEVFNYDDQDELANKFKEYIDSRVSEDSKCIEIAKNPNFWKLLVGFDEFYSKNKGQIIVSMEKALENDVIPSATSNTSLRKVNDLEEITRTKILYELDFSGLDLSEISFDGYTIFNCNFHGTNAAIDVSKINQETSLCYIRGKKVDRLNLCDSCFKGCKLTGYSFENMNRFIFSRDTFDEKVYRRSGFALEGIDETVIDKYYRKIWPNVIEFGILLKKLDKATIFKRYKDIENHSEFGWILLFEEVFPDNNIFISL